MIESALNIFEMEATFLIVEKTSVDAFYGKNTSDYTTVTDKAVIVPHGYTFLEPDTNIGIESFGKVDVYTRYTLKKDDLVVYNGKNYVVLDKNDWISVLGDYSVYVCQVQVQ